MADLNKSPPRRHSTAENPDEVQRIMSALQTEFKGKTGEEIRHAVDQACKPGVPNQSYDHVIEEARVLLGAGSRG